MESIVLLLENENQAHWTIIDQSGERISPINFNTLPEITAFIENRKVIVFIYSKHVNLLKTAIPTRQHNKLQQAIPFSIENQLAEDISLLHFTYIEQAPKQQLVTIVKKSFLDHLLSLLETHHIHPDRIYPTFMGLGYKQDHWTMMIGINEILINIEPYYGFWFELDEMEFMVEKIIKQHPKPKQLRIYLMNAIELNPLLNIFQKHAITYYIDDRTSYSTLSILASTIPTLPETNLLQTSFVTKHNLNVTKKYWATAFVTLFCALSCVAIRAGILYKDLVNQNLEASKQIKAYANQLFPKKVLTNQEFKNNIEALTRNLEIIHQDPLRRSLKATGEILLHQKNKLKLISLHFTPQYLNLNLETFSPEYVDTLIKEFQSYQLHAEQIQYEIKEHLIKTKIRVSL